MNQMSETDVYRRFSANVTLDGVSDLDENTEIQLQEALQDILGVIDTSDSTINIRRLGRGGQGSVFRVEIANSHSNVVVALKVFSPEISTILANREPELADESGSLIVYPIHTHGDGYYAMECFDAGITGNNVMNPSLAIGSRLRFVRNIMSVLLDQRKEKGLFHRDVKPGNVLLDGQGRVRVLDYTIALRASELHSSGQVDDQLMPVAGTIVYMSPEAMKGEYYFGSDDFSVGRMIYEALGGRTGDGFYKQVFQRERLPLMQIMRAWLQREDAMYDRVRGECKRVVEALTEKTDANLVRPRVYYQLRFLMEELLHPDPLKRMTLETAASILDGILSDLDEVNLQVDIHHPTVWAAVNIHEADTQIV